MLKRIFFILLLCRLTFGGFFDDECNVPVEDRVRVGDQSIVAADCTKDFRLGLNCFDAGYGCYRSKYAVPGFTYKNGTLHNANGVLNPLDLSAQDPKICAKYCLEKVNCYGFTITADLFGGIYCYLKSYAYFPASHPTGYPMMRSFDRFAFSYSTCQQGTCSQAGTNEGNKFFLPCKQNCESKSACTHFTRGNSLCYSNDQCELKSNVGYLVSCSVKSEKLSPLSLYPTSSTTSLTDNNNSSCIDIQQHPYVVRFPFPGVNKPLTSIRLKVIGDGLLCFNTITTGNLLVYVPSKPQLELSFTGKFKMCELLYSESTICEFSCACNERYCEGVYIKTYSNNSAVKLCDIKFL